MATIAKNKFAITSDGDLTLECPDGSHWIADRLLDHGVLAFVTHVPAAKNEAKHAQSQPTEQTHPDMRNRAVQRDTVEPAPKRA